MFLFFIGSLTFEREKTMQEPQRTVPVSWREYLTGYRDTLGVLAWVWSELTTKEGRRWMLVFLGLNAVALLVFIVQPLAYAPFITGISDGRTQLVVLALAALACLALTQLTLGLLNSYARERLWGKNLLRMHDRVNELYLEKSLGQHVAEGTELNHESIEKAKGRIYTLQEMALFETTSIIMTILLSLCLLWYLEWRIACALSVLLAGHLAWSLYLNYHVVIEMTPIEKEFRAEHRENIERMEKIVRVKTSGKSASEQRRLSRWFASTIEKDRRFWIWYSWQSTWRESIGRIVWLSAIAYGGYRVYAGFEDIGFLAPLFVWTTQVVQNLWYFGHAERRINEQIPYIRAMREALTTRTAFAEDEGVSVNSNEPLAVRFDHVGMKYGEEVEGHLTNTLRDITFSIAPGERVALIGPSGAGKSTIMKLLLRFMDPSEGMIWVNGHRLADLRLTSWMERVGYIPQDAEILDGTIRYNLTFGLSAERQAAVTDDELWDVMRLLRIDFGARLVHGLDTVVGRNGMKLSGGERQRLMAGAAVIKRPVFMVIDEATSSLDSTTEKAVQEGLQQVLSGPAGALIVAHRLSTVRTMCDRFMVLRRLEETPSGEAQLEATASSFEELYRVSPTFRQLADDQGIRL
jgi:ABC-type multidrug transport system fused ATPase/permease subunit